MLQGQDIICFANDWDADPLSKKHIMKRLAAANRVLWVNSIGVRNPTASVHDARRIMRKLLAFGRGVRRLSTNLHLFSPLAIPFHGSALVRKFNRYFLALQVRLICRQIGFRNPITWTFVPSTADVVGHLGESRVIYHCTDEFTGFNGADKSAIAEMERQLIAKSDAVIVCSGLLQQAKQKQGVPTHLVTHGVEVAHFRKACDPRTEVPADIASIPGPIIGFFGLIEDWVDLSLIGFMAKARPEWSFVLIGRLAREDSPVRGLANVHLLGKRDYEQLPGYCKAFDVAVLPFIINELTLASNPLKLREYLAAGLPVVSSDIPEARRLEKHLRLAGSEQEFLDQVEEMVISRPTRRERVRRAEAMESESWDRKVEELSNIVERLTTTRVEESEAVTVAARAA